MNAQVSDGPWVPSSPDAFAGAPINPYAPPSATLGGGGSTADAELVRRQFLNHEASIRSIGSLYLLGAIFAGLLLALSLVGGVAMLSSGATADDKLFLFLLPLYALLAWLYLYIGRGLRRLDAKARLGATVFSSIGLFGFPLGTLINGYILWLLHSEKGKFVLTPEYREIVAQTPHIKYRTPLWLVVLALLLAALVVVGIVFAFH